MPQTRYPPSVGSKSGFSSSVDPLGRKGAHRWQIEFSGSGGHREQLGAKRGATSEDLFDRVLITTVTQVMICIMDPGYLLCNGSNPPLSALGLYYEPFHTMGHRNKRCSVVYCPGQGKWFQSRLPFIPLSSSSYHLLPHPHTCSECCSQSTLQSHSSTDSVL